jgi:hypothetical protein
MSARTHQGRLNPWGPSDRRPISTDRRRRTMAILPGSIIAVLLCSNTAERISAQQVCEAMNVTAVPSGMVLRTAGTASAATPYTIGLEATGPRLVLHLAASSPGGPYELSLREAGAESPVYHCKGTIGDKQNAYVSIDSALLGSVPVRIDLHLADRQVAPVEVQVFESRRTITIDTTNAIAKTVAIEAKSFIAPMATQAALEQGKPDEETNANLGFQGEVGNRLSAYEFMLQTDSLFSENPSNGKEETKQFRLWSKIEATAKCVDGTMASFSISALNTAFGKEVDFGWPFSISAQGSVMKAVQTVENGVGKQRTTVDLTYAIQGSPNPVSIPFFEGIRPRGSCTSISHEVAVRIACVGNKIEVSGGIGGSAFPSRRLWINDQVVDAKRQGPFEDLWKLCEPPEAPDLPRPNVIAPLPPGLPGFVVQ